MVIHTPQIAPPIAVFDLDGTLADTAGDLVGTLNVILEQEGLASLPVEQARDMIGAGARALIERGFEAARKELAPAHLDALFKQFMVHYSENICIRTQLFPGVIEALDRLEAAGFILAVCTNKIEEHSVRLLDALGISHRFAANCGRDTFAYFKPDPRHLTLTIARAGGDPSRAVMVGDSRTDIVTAQNAGIPSIAVPFGYTDVPVQSLNPDIVIDHFDELFAAVEALMKPIAA
ncbi:HAD family hydrolase [Microvirga guangxiensis]|uniref:Phosphoglycolate phosphatase n=1 Tax=Microvirga guangxiensis TaxID=549386 RepID=A0A1G5BYI3_9HYPH|nr:HAD family hydrolase [Microvirga guangxiensis]SCX95127.1 phosphoglycolate phosphatase [Microvirga guangxiensis]